jgi:hypothetical protein
MKPFEASTGYLPEGVHRVTLGEFMRTFVWNGRRRFLFSGLARAIFSLQTAGCRTVIVDGSFVTAKELPGDWDAAFDPVGVDPARLDPILIKHDDGRKAMKAKYLGDMFPWSAMACGASGSVYRQFFQKDRAGRPKGIVELQLQGGK